MLFDKCKVKIIRTAQNGSKDVEPDTTFTLTTAPLACSEGGLLLYLVISSCHIFAYKMIIYKISGEKLIAG